MNQDIHNFIQYLHQEKQTSENTEVSYERDLKKMTLYLTAHGVDRIDAVTPEVLNSYVINVPVRNRNSARKTLVTTLLPNIVPSSRIRISPFVRRKKIYQKYWS